jgi:transcriptional regulator with XRE-family HTH domain
MSESLPEDAAQVEAHFAHNVRAYRKARELSQDELAQRMTDRGFKFNQNTIWRIEQSKRPVRIGEAIALAEALELPSWRSLTVEPTRFQIGMKIDAWNRRAHDKYEDLKAAAAAYIDAQVQLAFCVREATDAGQTVAELRRSWLDIPAEEAVIHARIELEHEDVDAERISKEIRSVVDALRDHGLAAIVDPADFTHEPPADAGD